ncbi:hypothetical protein KM043_013126 [Ampulex compressa]|nr:hypothetical protein KM043_013126 [Ampulex compressa]
MEFHAEPDDHTEDEILLKISQTRRVRNRNRIESNEKGYEMVEKTIARVLYDSSARYPSACTARFYAVDRRTRCKSANDATKSAVSSYVPPSTAFHPPESNFLRVNPTTAIRPASFSKVRVSSTVGVRVAGSLLPFVLDINRSLRTLFATFAPPPTI